MKRSSYLILLFILLLFSITFFSTYSTDGFGEYKYRDTDMVGLSTAQHDKQNYIKSVTFESSFPRMVIPDENLEGFAQFTPENSDIVIYSNASHDKNASVKNAMFNIQIPTPKKFV